MTAALSDASAAERLWTVDEVSAFLQVPVATLYQWRHHRIGPPAFKVGRHLRYDPAAVRSWLTGQGAQRMPVDDLWYLAARGPDGSRLPSVRHGRGKRWRVRWLDDRGVRRAQHFERKADADRHDANVRADLSRGQYIDDRAGRITVAALAERWRADQLHIESTAILVEHAVRLHIAPGIGQMQVGRVRPSNVQAWVKDRSRVLAPTTVRVVYGYLRSVFASAVRDRLIASSPCVDIRLPGIDRGKRVIPTPEQVHRLAELMPTRLAATVYVAAGCGLRLGEVLGLEAGDIDFDEAELTVRQQLKMHKGRPPYLGRPKTKTSAPAPSSCRTWWLQRCASTCGRAIRPWKWMTTPIRGDRRGGPPSWSSARRAASL